MALKSRRLAAFIALLALGGVFVIFSKSDVPTIGLVEPVYASVPEQVETLELAKDQTLGDLISGTLDANEQYSLILALRERVNPRRLRAGTEIAFRWLNVDPPRLRLVDITLNADETVRSEVGWKNRLRLQWRGISVALDPLLHTAFVPVSFGSFESGSEKTLAGIDASFRATAGRLPGHGIVAAFTEIAPPRKPGTTIVPSSEGGV